MPARLLAAGFTFQFTDLRAALDDVARPRSTAGARPTCRASATITNINEAFERVVKGDVKYRFVIDMKTLKA